MLPCSAGLSLFAFLSFFARDGFPALWGSRKKRKKPPSKAKTCPRKAMDIPQLNFRKSIYTPQQKSGQDFAASQLDNVTVRRFY
jgi:hypothetical protein